MSLGIILFEKQYAFFKQYASLALASLSGAVLVVYLWGFIHTRIQIWAQFSVSFRLCLRVLQWTKTSAGETSSRLETKHLLIYTSNSLGSHLRTRRCFELIGVLTDKLCLQEGQDETVAKTQKKCTFDIVCDFGAICMVN